MNVFFCSLTDKATLSMLYTRCTMLLRISTQKMITTKEIKFLSAEVKCPLRQNRRSIKAFL